MMSAEVTELVRRWPIHSEAAGVFPHFIGDVQKKLRLDFD
jgi:hypothetical protein